MEPRTLRWIGLAVCLMAMHEIAEAFVLSPTSPVGGDTTMSRYHGRSFLQETTSSSSSSASSSSDMKEEEPSMMNPTRPGLPAVPGDFDWDAKYRNDPDWLMGDAVPGKRKLSELELASQATALGGLEEKWRRERAIADYEASAKTGFVPKAELLNGRAAMFFLVTGLLTEYWTGISIPGQVEEMLRIVGVIGFD